jgi:thiamine biosynthesis lipoprotein
MREVRATFPCFGGTASISLTARPGADSAVASMRTALEGWHARFTRFDPGSELSRLNADPASSVAASDVFCRFAAAAVNAAAMTGGLVDPTLVDELEQAGYGQDLNGRRLPGTDLRTVPARHAAHPHPAARWRQVKVDVRARTVTRPPGVRLDSGGIVKGLLADVLALEVGRYEAFAIDCGGDIRIGGDGNIPRIVRVDDPFGRSPLHEFQVRTGGVATSGIGRRSWLDDEGRLAHHLIDPATGKPAFTGVVQATALAPTALEAETLAKAAVLGGIESARSWLQYGGVVVCDDGDFQVVAPTGVDAR